MKEYLDLDRDYDALIHLSKESLENARIISKWLSSNDKKFYDFVNEILPQYPIDNIIRKHIASGVEQLSLVHLGWDHESLDSMLSKINEQISNPKTHPVTHEWLYEIKKHITEHYGKHIDWDYSIDINTFRGYIDDKDSEMRLWAIGRILKHGKIKDIQEWLSIEDIEEALQNMELPEDKKQWLEKVLPVWKNAI